MSFRMILWLFMFLFLGGWFVLTAGVKTVERSVGESEYAYGSGTARLRIARRLYPRRVPAAVESLPMQTEKM